MSVKSKFNTGLLSYEKMQVNHVSILSWNAVALTDLKEICH